MCKCFGVLWIPLEGREWSIEGELERSVRVGCYILVLGFLKKFREGLDGFADYIETWSDFSLGIKAE